jgi:hypothetical protein
MYHPFLESFLETVLKRETIKEEDIYNLLFRDLPTYGHVVEPYADKDFN